MHISIAIFIIIVTVYRGVWKDWEKYHATMLFFGFMELIYDSITKEKDYFLWRITPEIFPSRIPLIGLYVFIIFPFSALLFLSKLPNKTNKQILHVAKWVCIYTFVEAIGSIFHRIEYLHSWSLWHSFIFNIVLFTGLILHHKKAIIAYITFLTVTIIGAWVLKIPI
jgi:hypothetical protein